MSLLVLDTGPLSTVQDLGRTGYAMFGVSPAGAMDPWALRLGNLLVGNEEALAGIEFTLSGPTVAFENDTVVALTGSRFATAVLRSVTGSAFERDVDTRPAPHNESFVVHAGESLRIGKSVEGARGYLSVRGGIEVESVLGSRSTHVSSGLGGRVLKQGDRLEVGSSSDPPLRRLQLDSTYRTEQTLRALPGPQEGWFTDDSLARFFRDGFTVTPDADRAGIRLDCEPLTLSRPADIDPEGVVTGAVQVPADGRPILLCNDRPATGGYAKIAVVIAADVSIAAHARPGDVLGFARTTPEEARAAWHAREEGLYGSIEDLS